MWICQAALLVSGSPWAPLPIQNGGGDGWLGPRLLYIQNGISVAFMPWEECWPGHLEHHLGHCTFGRQTHCLSTLRIKKIWWDQIPTPARSPLVAIIIQDAQVRGCRCCIAWLPAMGRVGGFEEQTARDKQGGARVVTKPRPASVWARYYFCHVLLVTVSPVARSERQEWHRQAGASEGICYL